MKMKGPISIFNLTEFHDVLATVASQDIDSIPVTHPPCRFSRPENYWLLGGPFRNKMPLNQEAVFSNPVTIGIFFAKFH